MQTGCRAPPKGRYQDWEKEEDKEDAVGPGAEKNYQEIPGDIKPVHEPDWQEITAAYRQNVKSQAIDYVEDYRCISACYKSARF